MYPPRFLSCLLIFPRFCLCRLSLLSLFLLSLYPRTLGFCTHCVFSLLFCSLLAVLCAYVVVGFLCGVGVPRGGVRVFSRQALPCALSMLLLPLVPLLLVRVGAVICLACALTSCARAQRKWFQSTFVVPRSLGSSAPASAVCFLDQPLPIQNQHGRSANILMTRKRAWTGLNHLAAVVNSALVSKSPLKGLPGVVFTSVPMLVGNTFRL